MANALFAREIVKFRTFGRSFTTCFAALMGDFDLSEMKDAGRTMAMFWFISFQVTMVLIMLNMLLAIIMDIYTDVKSHVRDVQNLHIQLAKMFIRWQQNKKGLRIPLKEIEHGIRCYNHWTEDRFPHATADGELLFTLNAFYQAVPGLGEKQARRIMVNAVRNYRFQHETPMGLSEAMRAISDIKTQIRGVVEYSMEGRRSAGWRRTNAMVSPTSTTCLNFQTTPTNIEQTSFSPTASKRAEQNSISLASNSPSAFASKRNDRNTFAMDPAEFAMDSNSSAASKKEHADLNAFQATCTEEKVPNERTPDSMQSTPRVQGIASDGLSASERNHFDKQLGEMNERLHSLEKSQNDRISQLEKLVQQNTSHVLELLAHFNDQKGMRECDQGWKSL
eukprot:gnl/MRDRNA2_/MRDRNA2_291431_c0_seq1.p1 gnl/MRDRNA2_/MRDRNA2_291431_c0~~gnl/MRDRNA2_/MRDRNA2_291431_c0_seq1.p1  ORF type:complete len:439 (+),score=75.59 gnl/MRDRNA2_/MRDRNA2_291431_c0_seq1:142-1317(+)